jgi:hypothetical protein
LASAVLLDKCAILAVWVRQGYRSPAAAARPASRPGQTAAWRYPNVTPAGHQAQAASTARPARHGERGQRHRRRDRQGPQVFDHARREHWAHIGLELRQGVAEKRLLVPRQGHDACSTESAASVTRWEPPRIASSTSTRSWGFIPAYRPTYPAKGPWMTLRRSPVRNFGGFGRSSMTASGTAAGPS